MEFCDLLPPLQPRVSGWLGQMVEQALSGTQPCHGSWSAELQLEPAVYSK